MKNLVGIASTFWWNQKENIQIMRDQWDREVSSLVRVESNDKSITELAGTASLLNSLDR